MEKQNLKIGKIVISFIFSHHHANIIDLIQYKKNGVGVYHASITVGTEHRRINDALFIVLEGVQYRTCKQIL